jgi:hypothetical protein
MKHLLTLTLLLCPAAATVAVAHPAADTTFALGNISWAQSNLDAWATFDTTPSGAGKTYKWGDTAWWSAAGNIVGWDTLTNHDKFDQCCYWRKQGAPCPRGWRMPTDSELLSLLSGTASTDSSSAMPYLVVHPDTANPHRRFRLPLPGERWGKHGDVMPNTTVYWTAEGDMLGLSSAFAALGLHIQRQPYEAGLMWCSTASGGYIRCVRDVAPAIEPPPPVQRPSDTTYSTFSRVKIAGKWGLVDTARNLLSALYDDVLWCRYVSPPSYIVRRDSKYGALDARGRETVPCRYDYLAHDGFFRPQDYYLNGKRLAKQGKRWGMLDIATGETIVPFVYDTLIYDTAHPGYIIAQKDGRWGLISTTGKAIIKPKYLAYHRFSTEVMAMQASSGRWKFFSTAGKKAKLRFDQLNYVSPYHHGLAMAAIGRSYGYIDTAGRVVVPFVYDMVHDPETEEWYNQKEYTQRDIDLLYHPYFANAFHNGYAAVHRDYCWGIIDSTGREVIPCQYSSEEFDTDKGCVSEGLLVLRRDNKDGFVDLAQRTTIPFEYDEALPFHRGLALVRQGRLWGFINRSNEQVAPIKYYRVEYDDHGAVSDNRRQFTDTVFAAVFVKDSTDNIYMGFIDVSGREAIPCRYHVGHLVGQHRQKMDGSGDTIFLMPESVRGYEARLTCGEESEGYMAIISYAMRFDEATQRIPARWNGQEGWVDKQGRWFREEE